MGTKVGYKRLYKVRISEVDLHYHHRSLQGFRDSWAAKSAAVNNGVSIPLEIVGIEELPPVSLRVVTNGTQVGIQGATYLVSKFFDIKRLGATGSTATFSWEADDKVYVCHEPWSQDRVRDLLIEATTRQM